MHAVLGAVRNRPSPLIARLLLAVLLPSYGRSFWIGSVLGLVLLIPLAGTRRRRMMIMPSVLLIGLAIGRSRC